MKSKLVEPGKDVGRAVDVGNLTRSTLEIANALASNNARERVKSMFTVEQLARDAWLALLAHKGGKPEDVARLAVDHALAFAGELAVKGPDAEAPAPEATVAIGSPQEGGER